MIVINSFTTRVTWCTMRAIATRAAWWSTPCPPPSPPCTVCPGTCHRTAATPSVGPGRRPCSRRSWGGHSVLLTLNLDVFLTVILSSKIFIVEKYLNENLSQVHVHIVHGEVPPL